MRTWSAHTTARAEPGAVPADPAACARRRGRPVTHATDPLPASGASDAAVARIAREAARS